MFDPDTLYLILAMSSFVLVAVVLVHHHNCADTVRRKRNEVQNIAGTLEKKIAVLEKEVVDLQIQIDEVDEQINVLEEQSGS